MKVKDSEKTGLKHSKNDHGIRSHSFMTNRCEKVAIVTDFIFLGSKITAEMKRCLLLGRKALTNLDSILKSGYITLPTKIHIVKTTVFTVVT